MLFRRLQWYVARQVLASFLLTLSVIMGAILLVDVVEQFRTVGNAAGISFFTAVQLSAMKMPMLLEHTMPFIVLVGAMLAFSRLSRLTELPAMRAAGVSAWRFLFPLALIAGCLGLFTTLVLNPVGADLNSNFESTREKIVGGSQSRSTADTNGIWLRQGSDTDQFVIHATGTEQSGCQDF